MMQTRSPSRKAISPKMAHTRPMTCSPACAGAIWKKMASTSICREGAQRELQGGQRQHERRWLAVGRQSGGGRLAARIFGSGGEDGIADSAVRQLGWAQ